jgi:hypothetical protein
MIKNNDKQQTYMIGEIKVPDYYIGISGQTVEDVLNDFDLNTTHHLASATEYIFRCKRKHETPKEDLKKAIHHLILELKRIEKE